MNKADNGNFFIGLKMGSWYNQNKRDLPWRHTQDPYKIWLSEIILQQTRVNQGLPYYQSFIREFPTVSELAAADEDQILRLWQGLGYYSRARNLHACAKEIAYKRKGLFPQTFEALKKLKGVGDYTAAAIASFAFGEKVPVLDGNVFRVLSRLFGIQEDILSSKGKKVFFDLSKELIAGHDPSRFNQAIMEFGALHCTPKNPLCQECVLAEHCYAFQYGLQQKFPVKKKKAKVRKRYFHYLVLEYKDRLLMKKRGDNDIWKGLYDFLLIEGESAWTWDQVCSSLAFEQMSDSLHLIDDSSSFILLSHQKIMANFFHVEIRNDYVYQVIAKQHNLTSFSKTEIDALPKPVLVLNYLNARKI